MILGAGYKATKTIMNKNAILPFLVYLVQCLKLSF